jgi:hypothetical protein
MELGDHNMRYPYHANITTGFNYRLDHILRVRGLDSRQSLYPDREGKILPHQTTTIG